ncbi:A-agglutinin anchorage subunit-like [Portunus trituberculatus]|uniref:A-agglutinin anchorage subunit-like n=1 Tax=Portunus trituberculatus TaxID=210409 RepID=UPI001E1CF623|nr:A-agglutinin anchorage subunit-like [Portunus trituberculatus]
MARTQGLRDSCHWSSPVTSPSGESTIHQFTSHQSIRKEHHPTPPVLQSPVHQERAPSTSSTVTSPSGKSTIHHHQFSSHQSIRREYHTPSTSLSGESTIHHHQSISPSGKSTIHHHQFTSLSVHQERAPSTTTSYQSIRRAPSTTTSPSPWAWDLTVSPACNSLVFHSIVFGRELVGRHNFRALVV